jgi:hypothetical protein
MRNIHKLRKEFAQITADNRYKPWVSENWSLAKRA